MSHIFYQFMFVILHPSLLLIPRIVRQGYWPNLGHSSKRMRNASLLKPSVLCNSIIFPCILICIHRTFKILHMKNPQVWVISILCFITYLLVPWALFLHLTTLVSGWCKCTSFHFLLCTYAVLHYIRFFNLP
jgi:hypothetical protein